MSLSIVIYNHHGIVISADRLVNAIIEGKEIHQSFTEQKLFLVNEKYGLSYTGAASINNIPVSSLIDNYLSKNESQDISPEQFLKNIATYFNSIQASGQNIVFIFCGYYEGQRFVLTTNTIMCNVSSISNPYGILYSGENDFVGMIVNSKIIAFDFAKFTMQDSVDFLLFINKTISKIMQFGQYFPTVSESCDILAICPNKFHWVEHLVLD